MVQMIALDLDGTLLQPDSTLSAAAEDALTKAISQGICIVVASGRAFTALPEKIRHFAGIRYAVTSNGAAVSELPAGKLLCAGSSGSAENTASNKNFSDRSRHRRTDVRTGRISEQSGKVPASGTAASIFKTNTKTSSRYDSVFAGTST